MLSCRPPVCAACTASGLGVTEGGNENDANAAARPWEAYYRLGAIVVTSRRLDVSVCIAWGSRVMHGTLRFTNTLFEASAHTQCRLQRHHKWRDVREPIALCAPRAFAYPSNAPTFFNCVSIIVPWYMR